MTDKQIFWFEVFCGGAFLIIVTWSLVSWRVRHSPQPRFEELARIQETVSFSLGGVLAVLMLVLFNLAMPVIVFVGVEVPSLAAPLGAAWIAGNVLWATGAIGRRHDYRVIRYLPSSGPPGL